MLLLLLCTISVQVFCVRRALVTFRSFLEISSSAFRLVSHAMKLTAGHRSTFSLVAIVALTLAQLSSSTAASLSTRSSREAVVVERDVSRRAANTTTIPAPIVISPSQYWDGIGWFTRSHDCGRLRMANLVIRWAMVIFRTPSGHSCAKCPSADFDRINICLDGRT